jgi:ATP-dependent Lhr-like helicase
LTPFEEDGACVLLLGGRHWHVADVDWPRRRVTVAPAVGGGRTRWLGSARGLSAVLAGAQERVLIGATPACHLSKRANAKLTDLRDNFEFLDGESLPVVCSRGTVTIWTFAGGRACAAMAGEMRRSGLRVAHWDDLSVTVRCETAEPIFGPWLQSIRGLPALTVPQIWTMH